VQLAGTRQFNDRLVGSRCAEALQGRRFGVPGRRQSRRLGVAGRLRGVRAAGHHATGAGGKAQLAGAREFNDRLGGRRCAEALQGRRLGGAGHLRGVRAAERRATGGAGVARRGGKRGVGGADNGLWMLVKRADGVLGVLNGARLRDGSRGRVRSGSCFGSG